MFDVSWFATMSSGSRVSSPGMTARLRRGSERGATAVEYGLMVSFIALLIVGTVTVFGGEVSNLFILPSGAL